MPYKDPDKRRRADRERMEKWRKRNPLKNLEASKRWRVKLREDVLRAYSNGKMECACCGETEVKFLTIDHVDNDGAKHRLSHSGHRNGGGWLTALRARNYPPGFQVLCYNCNCAKGRYGKCPHQKQ